MPRGARGVWAQCLARALSSVATHNTHTAWAELLMLPKAVLCPAPRSGSARRAQATNFTTTRCRRWLDGERDELWPSQPRRRRTPPAAATRQSAQQSRCITLAAEGEYSRACSALVAPPLLEASPDIQQKLLAKHPRATAARPGLLGLGPAPVGAVPDITTHAVSNAVRGFRRGTAAGPSGLRSDHLREALQTAHCDEVLTHLTAVVHLLAAGQVPLDLAPHLAGATLHALPKGDADVRPIAVGETLRRLVAKCLCHTVKDLARDYLHPLQVGVSVPLGAEAAIHTARQWCQRSAGKSDMVFLSLDFENAFNSIDRLGMLREIRLRFPGLAPWAEWTYGGPSRLLFHGEAFTSEAGVQQGDPLGPLFFALALQPALRAVGLRTQSGPELLFAYLDDVCLAGSWHEVASALQRLHGTARQAGLRLNPHKCILTTCAGPEHSVDLAAFPSGFQLNTSGQFSILGAPIGSASFCESFTSTKRIETAKPLLHQIAELPDPQTGLLLLRDCASWCKFSFSTRVTPPASITQASANFDNEIRHCLESMCTGPLSPDAWLQASLSTSSGGLGLRHSARHGPAAYAISLFHTQLLCNALDPQYPSNHSEAFQSATQDVLPADRLPTPLPPTLRQQQLSQALDRATVEHLARPAPGREAFRAHLKLLQQPGAGAWLHAPPSEALGLHVASSLFIVMVQMRLRLPVGDQDMPCPLCDGVLDRHGDHARVCPCGGDRTKRHHRLRSIVAARAHAAGLIPKSKKLASSHLGPMIVVAPKTVLARLVVAVALQTFGSAVGGCMALQLLIWLSRPVFDKAALLLLPQQVNELLPIMKPKNVLSSTPTRSVKQRAFNSSHWLLKQLAGAGAQRP